MLAPTPPPRPVLALDPDTTPPKADRLLICGGMAYTFLAAQGHRVGSSLLETEQIPR